MMRRTFFATFLMVAVVGLLLIPQPAAAQLVPPQRNAASFSFATFNPTLYMLGFSYAVAPAWDLNFSYSWQSIGGTTASLLALGARYRFAVANPALSPYVGGGFASIGAGPGGFPSVSASGLYLTAGASLLIDPRFIGYVGGTMVSVSGASNSVIDLGLQFRIAPTAAAQIGYVNFSGTGAPYLGVTIALR